MTSPGLCRNLFACAAVMGATVLQARALMAQSNEHAGATATTVAVIRDFASGADRCRSRNPNVRLTVDTAQSTDASLVVDYPPPSDDPAGRDVWCEAEQHDWTGGRMLTFQVRAERPTRMSLSFFDRNRVAYTTWIDITGSDWQTVDVAFEAMKPNPYFQRPDAKQGAPIDVSEVAGFGFAPQDKSAGRLTLSPIVLRK